MTEGKIIYEGKRGLKKDAHKIYKIVSLLLPSKGNRRCRKYV